MHESSLINNTLKQCKCVVFGFFGIHCILEAFSARNIFAIVYKVLLEKDFSDKYKCKL